MGGVHEDQLNTTCMRDKVVDGEMKMNDYYYSLLLL